MKISEIALIEDSRILLRLCREEDAEDLKGLFDAPLTAEQTVMMINHFTEAYKEGKEANLAIEDKETGRAVGIVSLYDIRQDHSVAIGYRIREEERGKHYAADAVRLISPVLLEEYGASVIRGSAHTDNFASVNILTNSGYKLVAQQGSVCMFIFDQESADRLKKKA